MKRLVLLLVVALLALPSLALATDYGICPPPPFPVEKTGTFQAYGEATAGYSVGCATVDACIFSVDSRTKTIDCLAADSRNCGLNASVCENSFSTTIGSLHQVSAVGSTNATMLGTASVCGDPGAFSAGTGFNQSNLAVSSASFDGCKAGCPAVSGSGSAVTTQTFNAAPARGGSIL